MFTMFSNSTRLAATTAAAVAIVSFGALALDQSYIASAPRGTVEVGELTLVDVAQTASVMLPEITVVAKRVSDDAFFAMVPQLPEVVVVAKRVAYMVAKADATAQQAGAASVQGPVEGALLK
jgi:hypothetical protein